MTPLFLVQLTNKDMMTFSFRHCLLSFLLIVYISRIQSREAAKRKEVDDAIRYLADLDRVYSEHVRPRFGKRGLEVIEVGEKKRSTAAFVESFLKEDRIMREFAKYMENMVRR